MLRAVTIQNFILFRERQRLKLEDGANFIIGANGTGKSSIFELVRRCLSKETNMSASNIHNKERAGFVVCEFGSTDSMIEDLAKIGIQLYPGTIFTCIFAKHQDGKTQNVDGLLHKVVFLQDKTQSQLFVQSCEAEFASSRIFDFIPVNLDRKDYQSLSGLLESFISSLDIKPDDKHDHEALQSIAETLKDAYNKEILRRDENIEDSSGAVAHASKDNQNETENVTKDDMDEEVQNRCEEVLKILTERVVTLFGKRSVDPSMWDKSSQRRSAHATGDYFTSRHEKAEIFVELLSKRNQEYIDQDQERMFFNALIFPQRYVFELDENTMACTAINKNTDLKTSLLKTSEGIIEAKQLSLLLSHSKYHTILIQNPEKGMHPPMIEKLRDLVLRRIRKKVVIVSSHNQNLIASWSLPRTFMCQFHYIQIGHYENTVVPCKSLPQNALAGDELKKIPFSAHVLFVEGPSDKKMIRSVLYLIQDKITTNKECEILDGIEDKESFCNFISLLTIVSQDGAKNHLNLQRTCDILGISYTFIYDTDVFISKAKQVKRTCLLSYISDEEDRKQAEVLDFTEKKEEFLAILAKSHIFMWTCGNIEDVFLEKDNVARETDPKKKLKLSKADFTSIEHYADKAVAKPNEEVKRLLGFLYRTTKQFIEKSQRPENITLYSR